ncbi:hypothetical protein PG999_008929 [Apiospora kogelbergensis]|uniref:CHK kinase-like domain-containing protein n=1 Tax=Apiospora kogelbergensis TaxID=1337665 RepID=A0AAW0QUT0_9PEZI
MVEEVAATWCSKILNGAPVTDVEIVSASHGSSSSLVVQLAYADDSDTITATSSDGTAATPPTRPRRIFFKGGLNPDLAALGPLLQATYRREAEFYHHLAPRLLATGQRLARPHYAGVDTTTGQGIVVLEDLAARGCSFGRPQDAWPAARVRAGVEQLAILHAKTWEGRPACPDDSSTQWCRGLGPLGGFLRPILQELIKPEPFAAVAARNIGGPDGGRFADHLDVLLDRERIVAAFEALWKAADGEDHSSFRCVVHGDTHVVNTFTTAEGEPGFLDWQTVSRGNGFHDLAYFVSSALAIEDRRVHEQDLVRAYIEALQAQGGPRVEWEDAWFQYRRHLLHGYVLCLAQPSMQPQDYIWALTERFLTAILDHKVLTL